MISVMSDKTQYDFLVLITMPPSDQNSRKLEQESNRGQKGFPYLDKCFNKVNSLHIFFNALKVHICEVKKNNA